MASKLFKWDQLDADSIALKLTLVSNTEFEENGDPKRTPYDITLIELPKQDLEGMIKRLMGGLADEIKSFTDMISASVDAKEAEAAAALNAQQIAEGGDATAAPEVNPDLPVRADTASMTNAQSTDLFVALFEKQSEIVFEYLGKGTRRKDYNAEWFKARFDNKEITERQFAGLLYNLWEICHVDEVISSAGNVLTLARYMASGMMAEQASSEEEQKTTAS